MALVLEIEGNLLVIRSVGDHTMAEGMAQMDKAMEMAKAHFDKTAEKLHLFFDMQESKEQKTSEELKGIANYFTPHLEYMSGRMAVFVSEKVHYGLSRLYAVYAGAEGMEVMPFYDRAEALEWLNC